MKPKSWIFRLSVFIVVGLFFSLALIYTIKLSAISFTFGVLLFTCAAALVSYLTERRLFENTVRLIVCLPFFLSVANSLYFYFLSDQYHPGKPDAYDLTPTTTSIVIGSITFFILTLLRWWYATKPASARSADTELETICWEEKQKILDKNQFRSFIDKISVRGLVIREQQKLDNLILESIDKGECWQDTLVKIMATGRKQGIEILKRNLNDPPDDWLLPVLNDDTFQFTEAQTNAFLKNLRLENK